MKTAETFAKKFFPKGYPELSEQWLDCLQDALEAQHRETWAEAMKLLARDAWDAPLNMLHARDIETRPCPPFEPKGSEEK